MTKSTDDEPDLPPITPFPPLYTPFKYLSPRLAVKLWRAPISSNALTVAWATLLVGASVALALQRPVLALLLVCPAILFDCLDGDLARVRKQPSVSGTFLEQIAHWTGNMSLMVGAGAAVLLADPSPRNVLLASTLAVVQAIYIAVIRQVRPDSANIPEHPGLRRVFRFIIEVLYNLSPIELPLVGLLVVFGVTRGVVLAITVGLAVSSALVFVMHFILIRAVDRRQWTGPAKPPADAFHTLATRYAEALLLTQFPAARWWTPGTPELPSQVCALTGRQPMASGAPVLISIWRELAVLLPQLFRTSGRVLPLSCPTEAAIEAVLGTLCRPGDEILVAAGRSTIVRWRTIAERLGVQVAHLEVPFGGSVQPAELASILAARPALKAVCLSMAEAEDGVRADLAAIAEVVRGGSALVVVDACLSLCADDLRMDEWGIDVAVSSSSSGVMAPPGVSLIALGPRAIAALDQPVEGPARGGYLDLRSHVAERDRPLAPLPAPTLGGLYLSVQMILASGLDTILEHRARIAERFRRGCVERAGLVLVAPRPTAACTTALLPEDVRLDELQGHLFNALQMVVASGSTPEGGTTLQLGHAGWLFDDDIDRAVEALAVCIRAARVDAGAEPIRSSL